MNKITDHRVSALECTYQYILNLSNLDIQAPFNDTHRITGSLLLGPSEMFLSVETTQAATRILEKICELEEGQILITNSDIPNMLVQIINNNLHSHIYDRNTGTYNTHTDTSLNSANASFKYRHNIEYLKQIVCLAKYNILNIGKIEDNLTHLIIQSEEASGSVTMRTLKTIMTTTLIQNNMGFLKKLYAVASEVLFQIYDTGKTDSDNISRCRRVVHTITKSILSNSPTFNWLIPSKEHELNCIRLLDLQYKLANGTELIKPLFNTYTESITGDRKYAQEYNQQFVKQKCEEFYPSLMKKLNMLQSLSDCSYYTIYKAHDLNHKSHTILPEFTL